MVKDQLLTKLVDALAENTTTIGTGLVLILAAQMMQAGTFSVGDFALFVAYIWPIMELLRSTGVILAGYKQAGVSVKRMGLLMQDAPSSALTAPSPVHLSGDLPAIPYAPKIASDQLKVLEVRDLNYQHQRNSTETMPGLNNINLRLERGTFTVITGRIGSGKSTLLRVLLGLLPADSGQIMWNEQLIENPTTFFVPPRVAYTPQVPQLFSESLRANILQGLPENKVDLTGAIEQAILSEDVAEMEKGLDTLLGSRGVRLSGGQSQRTATARMFVRQPELLVFDDVSSALDGETEQKLWAHLCQQEDVTCLAISHRQAALRQADQIIVLQAGRVLDVGHLDDLLERCEEMRLIWVGNRED